MSMKKLYIKTFGCQMNVYDSSRMADILQLKGYESTDKIEECDIFIMNTCHIREKASEKIIECDLLNKNGTIVIETDSTNCSRVEK